MSADKLTKGSIVLSLAGHDKGYRFAVVEVLDDATVLIADGRKRKLISPKKKKAKHLLLLGAKSDLTFDSNKKLYKEIRDYCSSKATDNAK